MALRHVALIVRTEIRRRLRAVRGDDGRFGLLVVCIPLGVIALLVLAGWAYSIGASVWTGDASSAVDGFESAFARIFAVTVFVIALRGVQATGQSAPLEGILSAVRHRDVVYSLLALEFLVAFALTGIPGVVGGVAFALGAGSPATAVLVTVAVLSLVAIATEVGFAIGLGIRTALSRSRLLARHRAVAGVLALAGCVFVLLRTERPGLFEPIRASFGATPLSWFGDLAVLPIAPVADPLRAAGIVLTTVATLSVLTAVNDRLAGLLWYSSPVTSGTRATGAPSLPSSRRLDRRTRTVVRKTWMRAVRSPLRLVYVGYAGLLVGFLLANAIQHGDWPGWLAPVVGCYGAWATGAGFTLNPIGEESPALPGTLTSPITGRRFVGGLWLASAIPGVPITLLVTLTVASAAGFPLGTTVVVSLLCTALAAVAPGVASGVGAVFPQLEAESITRNRSAVVPSGVAFVLYSIALFVLVVPAWFALSSGGTRLASTTGLSPLAVGGVGAGITVLAAGAVAVASFRSASARFDAYTLP